MEATLVNTVKKGRQRNASELLPIPQLFILFESRRPRALSSRHSLATVDEVVIGRGKQREAERKIEQGTRRLSLRVQDPWMSSVHARIERRASAFILRDAGSTNGTVVNGEEIKEVTLADGDVIELGQTFLLFRAALPTSELESLDLDAADIRAPEGLVSLIPELAQRFTYLLQIVKSSSSLIILGQSGTGKEVVARAAHALSERSGEFVAVNCGGLPGTLVESEFFGHKKGAFSGATDDREGLVRAADKGTLFLDEIGDLPLTSQAVLLRVLQEKEVTPVGATRPIPVDFRLISATHRDMERLVETNEFREDLLSRLEGHTLDLPALADRIEDLGILIGALVERLAGDRTVTFSNEAARALINYHWPRNVRELSKTLEAAIALAGDERIELAHLGDIANGGKRATTQEPRRKSHDRIKPLSSEQIARRDRLVKLLKEHKGNISAVSRSMGKVRSQVQRWLRRYGLDPAAFKDD